MIDPGHGGHDPGAIRSELVEKDLTLTIALKIKQILDDQFMDHVVALSRYRDETMTLKDRTNLANRWQADYLMSIHINAGGGTGFESFTFNKEYPNKAKTNRLRAKIHDDIIKETGFKDRGKKEAHFHILRESKMSAILTENGFIDHDLDAKMMKSDSFLDKVARGHAFGLGKALSLKKRLDITNNPFYVVQQGDTLWRIAQKQQMEVADLLRLNLGINVRKLQIGQKIRLS